MINPGRISPADAPQPNQPTKSPSMEEVEQALQTHVATDSLCSVLQVAQQSQHIQVQQIVNKPLVSAPGSDTAFIYEHEIDSMLMLIAFLQQNLPSSSDLLQPITIKLSIILSQDPQFSDDTQSQLSTLMNSMSSLASQLPPNLATIFWNNAAMMYTTLSNDVAPLLNSATQDQAALVATYRSFQPIPLLMNNANAIAIRIEQGSVTGTDYANLAQDLTQLYVLYSQTPSHADLHSILFNYLSSWDALSIQSPQQNLGQFLSSYILYFCLQHAVTNDLPWTGSLSSLQAMLGLIAGGLTGINDLEPSPFLILNWMYPSAYDLIENPSAWLGTTATSMCSLSNNVLTLNINWCDNEAKTVSGLIVTVPGSLNPGNINNWNAEVASQAQGIAQKLTNLQPTIDENNQVLSYLQNLATVGAIGFSVAEEQGGAVTGNTIDSFYTEELQGLLSLIQILQQYAPGSAATLLRLQQALHSLSSQAPNYPADIQTECKTIAQTMSSIGAALPPGAGGIVYGQAMTQLNSTLSANLNTILASINQAETAYSQEQTLYEQALPLMQQVENLLQQLSSGKSLSGSDLANLANDYTDLAVIYQKTPITSSLRSSLNSLFTTLNQVGCNATGASLATQLGNFFVYDQLQKCISTTPSAAQALYDFTDLLQQFAASFSGQMPPGFGDLLQNGVSSADYFFTYSPTPITMGIINADGSLTLYPPGLDTTATMISAEGFNFNGSPISGLSPELSLETNLINTAAQSLQAELLALSSALTILRNISATLPLG